MAKNLDFVRIYGDDESGAWVGPRGTEIPLTLDDPPSGMEEVGWLSEDGIGETPNQSSESFRAYQGGTIVRKKITNAETVFRIQAIEENLVVHGLRYRGQEPTITGDTAVTEVKNQTRADTRAWILDMLDGDVWKRYVLPAGDYSQTGTVGHQNASLTTYEFEITPVGDYFEVTNNPAIVGDTSAE